MYVFGELLKQFRIRQGMEQQELASQLGMHRNTIVAWEGSDNLPRTRKKVLDLAKALYLDEEDTDQLLFAANYPLEYQNKKIEKAGLTQIKTARVEQLFVGQLQIGAGQTPLHLSARCDFYQHISLPQNIVQREEVSREVREALLSDTPTIALTSALQYSKPNALHGMGGIGKSVIARILCDDPKVQERFPDGILWVTLGQTPELVPKMRDWVNALGGTIAENAPTVDSLKVSLAKLLENRTCLLILDDVWQFAHAEVFRIGGPGCRLLLTTRDMEIAYKLGAKIQSVPVMTESEAVTLLEKWADGQISEVGLELKRRIVKRLGYLPLAVELTGAQLRRKHPEIWLHSFTIDKLKAPRADPKNIHDSLELTFRLSLNELHENVRGLYVALAIFKEDEAILQRGIEKLWQGLSGLDSDGTTDLLDDLASRALLQIDHSRKVELHDLLRDFIVSELKDRRAETHEILLNTYRTTWRGKGWHTADDDGYIYDHLAYHLHALGAYEELKGLFADQQWLQKRVPQRDYTYDGYLGDLTLAWEDAEAEARQQIEIGQEPSAFADCIRYLLVRTSINSIAGNYIPGLVARAIEVGIWTPFRAFSVAAKIPDGLDRIQMYQEIQEIVGFGNEQQKEAQRLRMEAALTIEDEEQRARVLTGLAPQLSGEQRSKVLGRALEAALAIQNEDQRAWLLTEVAPRLSRGMLERALGAAFALKDERNQAWVLAILLPLVSDQTRLLQSIWQAMMNYSMVIRDSSRAYMLDNFFIKKVFIAPIYSTEILQAIASHIVEICKEWIWL